MQEKKDITGFLGKPNNITRFKKLHISTNYILRREGFIHSHLDKSQVFSVNQMI